MTNPKTAVAGNDTIDAASPSNSRETVRVVDDNSFISDKRRVQNAIEDDEVWEALRALHRKREPLPIDAASEMRTTSSGTRHGAVD